MGRLKFNRQRFFISFFTIICFEILFNAVMFFSLKKASVDALLIGQIPYRDIYLILVTASVFTIALLVGFQFLFAKYASQKEKDTDRLFDMIHTDNMTGTKNRRAYFEEIRKLNESHEKNVGIIFCDLNGLKTANDQFGHEAGDALINEAVVVLTEKFQRKDDKIFRIGGDEFVVIRKNISEEEFYGTTQLFIEALEEYPILSLGEIWIDECKDLETQIKKADEKMYQRKSDYYKKTGKDRRK